MNPGLGIGLKILSALVFTVMSAAIKWVGADYPTGEIVFFRSFFALLPLALWLSWNGNMANEIRTSNVKGHLLRGILSTCGMMTSFLALAYLPLSDAVAIGYASPILTVALAAILLREHVGLYRWLAVGVGFLGVIVMLVPAIELGGAGRQSDTYLLGAAISILASCCTAGATIQVRRMLATEKTGAIVFYFTVLTTAVGAATIVFGWKLPGPADLTVLVLIGILGGIGQILLTLSFRYAEASVVAPFDYTTMIWAVLIGWLLFGQLPNAFIVVGGTIVAGAGVFVIWREGRLRRARGETS